MNDDQINSLIRSILKLGSGYLTVHGASQLAVAINTPAVATSLTGILLAFIAMYGSHRNNATPLPAVTVSTTNSVLKTGI